MFANRPKMLVITGLSALFIFMACKKDNADANDTAPVDPVAAALNLPALLLIMPILYNLLT